MIDLYMVKMVRPDAGPHVNDSLHVSLSSAQARVRSIINQPVADAENVRTDERMNIIDRYGRQWTQFGETRWECGDGSSFVIECHGVRDDGMIADRVARGLGRDPAGMRVGVVPKGSGGPVAGRTRDHWGEVARDAWIAWAMDFGLVGGHPTPFAEMDETGKEEFRRVGEAVAREAASIAGRLPRVRPKK